MSIAISIAILFHLLVYLSAFAYFDQVGRAGVRFFRYTDGFLHQKVMLM